MLFVIHSDRLAELAKLLAGSLFMLSQDVLLSHRSYDVPAPQELPEDSIADRVRDYFLERYRTQITPEDAIWLSNLLLELLQFCELVRGSEERRAALKFIKLISGIDQLMCEAPNAARRWVSISLALALPSSCANNVTQAHAARACGVSKVAISREVKQICELLGVQNPFGTGRYPQLKNLMQ